MDKRVRAVLSVLDRDFASVPDYPDLAARLGLCLPRLEHLFKRDTGHSMRDHVRARRLEAAAELLAGSRQRISEIAWAVGYKDAANFNHAFHEHFGMSPRAYRNERRIEQLLPIRLDSNQR